MARPRSRMAYLERESTLTDWRIKRGITECDLAAACGISQQVVSGASFGKNPPVYVSGTRKGETKPWAPLMAEVLGVPLDVIFPRYFCALSPTEDNACPSDVFDASVSQSSRQDANRWGGRRHDHVKLQDAFRSAFAMLLSIKHQRVMVLRHFEDHTLEEIGERLGVTRERVRQIEQEAFRKIQHSRCSIVAVLKQIHKESQ